MKCSLQIKCLLSNYMLYLHFFLISDKSVGAGERELSVPKDCIDYAETKSNESKPVTPTESSTLLPDNQEGRTVKRLARKPVR